MSNNLVKVEGELYIKDGTGTMLGFYEEEFVLDKSVDTIDKARALIRKGLIFERLQKTVEGFRGVRTCQVLSITPTDEKIEDGELNKILLLAIQKGCVPANIENYKRPDYKIKALERAIEAHDLRVKKEARNDSNIKNLGFVDD